MYPAERRRDQKNYLLQLRDWGYAAMQPFRTPLPREDTRYHIREARADIEWGHAEVKRAILKSRARLAETRKLLMRIDAAIARFNALR